MSTNNSSSPQSGNQLPSSGIPVSTGPSGISISPINPSTSGSSLASSATLTATDGEAGDVLQASTTVTSLAVALTTLFPSTTLARMTIMTIGHWSLTLGPALLICGITALASSVFSLDKIRRKANLSGRALLFSHIGLLFIALFLFLLIYLGVAASYAF